MNSSDYLGNKHDDRLGVNKIGRNIRKSPPHQPNNTNPARQPPQPQVYNINKNDFRNIVQQLTGSPSRHSQEPLFRPPPNAPSNRLQRIRPPRLAPINVNRPQMPVHPGSQMPPRGAGAVAFSNNLYRPAQYGQPQAMVPPSVSSGDHMGWANTAESPISAYMRYLQNAIADSTQGHPQAHPFPSPRLNRPPPTFPSPRMAGPPPPLPLPSPRMNGPFIPPSPTSQFVMPSPSGYMNLLSPLSAYPLLSPGYQHPMPLTPNFSFSPMARSAMFGGPPSPAMGFPSPGFFNLSSPRWRN